MAAAIIVGHVSPASTKQDLWKHFRSRKRGGGPIEYLIFPFCEDQTKAFIAFRDIEVVESVLKRKHTLAKRTVTMELAAKQLSALCRVDIHPAVVSRIADLGGFVSSLECDMGAWAVDSDDSGRLCLSAPLAQLRSVAARLDAVAVPPDDGPVPGGADAVLVWDATVASPHHAALPDVDVVVYMRRFHAPAVQAIASDVGRACFTRRDGAVVVGGTAQCVSRVARLYADVRRSLHRHREPLSGGGAVDAADDVRRVFAGCVMMTQAHGCVSLLGGKRCVTAAVAWMRSHQGAAAEDGALHATLYWDGRRHTLAAVCCELARRHVDGLAATATERLSSNVTQRVKAKISGGSKTPVAAPGSETVAHLVRIRTLTGKPDSKTVAELARKPDSKTVAELARSEDLVAKPDSKTLANKTDSKAVAEAARNTALADSKILVGASNRALGTADTGSSKVFVSKAGSKTLTGASTAKSDVDAGELASSGGLGGGIRTLSPGRKPGGSRSEAAKEVGERRREAANETEHKGTPYCHVPCYGALFGPTMFGHGSIIDAHASFGQQSAEKWAAPPFSADLLSKLKAYNCEYGGSTLKIKSKEVNGRLVLDGTIRVHWGLDTPIQFKPTDDLPPADTRRGWDALNWRRSYDLAIDNGLAPHFTEASSESVASDGHQEAAAVVSPTTTVRRSNTVQLRSNRSRKRATRRKSMINGHVYDLETSIFTPMYNSTTSVTISSLDTTPNVIKMLLNKFKIENKPEDFCLCKVQRNGETRILREDDRPLIERVRSGPNDDVAKIFLMARMRVNEVSEEVAPFINLPLPMLEAFLKKYDDEETNAEMNIREKYRTMTQLLDDTMKQSAPPTQS